MTHHSYAYQDDNDQHTNSNTDANISPFHFSEAGRLWRSILSFGPHFLDLRIQETGKNKHIVKSQIKGKEETLVYTVYKEQR